jgi:aerobic carbon-monoxide dehydrogenase large subunit
MGGIRFGPNRDVTIITGTLDYGQGHWTPLARSFTKRSASRSTGRASKDAET